jgi:potassium-transporting ATPase potassium-binding subunit
MNIFDITQIAITLLVLLVAGPYLGSFIYKVFENEQMPSKFLRKIENGFYRICSIDTSLDSSLQMNWKTYALALLAFNALGFLIVFLLQIFQVYLPLNPANIPNVSWHSAFNTAVSFMTNTNWQGYSGESTLSYLTQMLGLTVQNFVSAATGIAVAIALCRGFTKSEGKKIGNFWMDLYRGTVYVLLPLSFVLVWFRIFHLTKKLLVWMDLNKFFRRGLLRLRWLSNSLAQMVADFLE